MRPNDFTDDNLANLIDLLRRTQAQELTCDEWLDRVSGYADAVAGGFPPPPGSDLVEQHLEVCPECREEFDTLVSVLRKK